MQWQTVAAAKARTAGNGGLAADSRRRLPASAGQHHIDLPPTAPRAPQPLFPIWDRKVGTMPLRHLGGVGLGLMGARSAPYDNADAGCGGGTERGRRAGLLHGRRRPARGGS
jgi:hypothetical protein